MRDIDSIFIHCSYSKPSQDWGASQIRKIHVEEKGFNDIGYHAIIRRDGVMEQGRDFSEKGAHAKGYNSTSIGICLIGGMDENGNPDCNFTAAQWKALEEFVRSVTMALDIDLEKVFGHRDVSDKPCPTFDVRAWVETLRG